ncbi:glycoside hydrolase family 3 protein [Anaerocolumna sp. MB42-C2]|uniref:glycoside hydrolase family 3 protein n=1 Tax=Anaerocolumna sp. MB42-C2 TaxID=3070997 RepID=UPI0027E0AB08|nr:glycoside hydrolase family 3 N-terminal domain-containing protein [Anaerocolumna sp. MB42-C2]WMJ86717.1 glycoside hydrolase family 3 N-terminal domain-containing protein [Anaerocolumna sp. MB42-C2]
MNINLIKILTIISILAVLTGCKNKPELNLSTNTTPSITPAITNAAETLAPVSTATPKPTSTVTPTPTQLPTKSPTQSPTAEPTPAANESKAEEILKGMTIEEKVGQLFFVRCIGEQALSDIEKYSLGGYILFGEDFKDKTIKDVKNIIAGYQNKSKIPMLIGVDEEGGTVNRLSKYQAFRAVPFKSPQDLYKVGGFDLIKSDTKEKADLLLSLGINVNLAPVCDVSTDDNDFIYKRAFGKNADQTSQYVKTVVSIMQKNGIGSTLKHFPGYGNNVDTHTGIAIDHRSYINFEKSDFLPFKAGIKAGAGSILVSHNVVLSMDKDYPASLSPKVHSILRRELGFPGVIITDDLSMDAIKEYTNEEEAAVQAIIAGNDLVIATDYNTQIPAVLNAIRNGKITEDRIDESVIRVLTWKLNLGIMN